MSTQTDLSAALGTRIAAGDGRTRYDDFTRTLHWLTVLLVLAQFGLSQTWGYFPRPTRHLMVVAHMSFGITLGAVVLTRIAWRWIPGHQIPAAVSGWVETLSKAVHYLLYALLVLEAALGFYLRWSGDQAMSFFGLQIPSPIEKISRQAHGLVGDIHNWVGWTIIVVAAGHALAALYHHFALHDDVLWRMLPGRRARRAEVPAPAE